MKIAVAADGMGVSEHFGHCEGFFLYEVQAGDIVEQSYLANPGHQPGLLPRLLSEAKAEVVIAGGMGAGAGAVCHEHSHHNDCADHHT